MKKAISPITYCLLFIIYCLLFSSCSPTRKLSEGELLLNKNVVTDKSSGIDKKEIETYIKQKPNRKMLFWKMYLAIYNSVNQNKMYKKKQKHDTRIDTINAKRTGKKNLINEKRKAEGKKIKKLRVKKKDRLTYREWLLSIGEPPVIYDSVLTDKSAKQIKLFLNNKGFFNSSVKDSIQTKNKKVTVQYIIRTGKPYLIRNISYEIKDSALYNFVLSNVSGSLISKGENYDLDVLDKERDRITSLLRNEGYFFFSKEYIDFEVDSSLNSREVDITLGIKNPVVKLAGKDTTVESTHKRYYINNVYVLTDYDPKNKTIPTDTLRINDINILSTGKLRFKPRLITDAIFIYRGNLYQQKKADHTYRKFSNLKMFRSVQVQFTDVGNSKLDCYVVLSNMPKQSFSAEAEGINTSATNGIAGNLSYQNKNYFKGGEIFEIKFNGSLEVQKTLSGSTSTNNPFNTQAIGGAINLYVPRFLTPFGIKGTQSNNAKTTFTANYDYQLRPDFERSVSNLSFGYSWNETSTKKHFIYPIELNRVDIFHLDPALESTVNNDLFLKNIYSNHFTIDTRYNFIFSNQNIRKNENFSYLKIGLEGAGNAMRGVFNYYNNHYTTLPKESNSSYAKNDSSYLIDNIPFSQYVRADVDFRYYKILTSTDKIAYRFVAGEGIPFSNLGVLPLEKSFFAGGPNDIRAWQARTLGPGGYNGASADNVADKIGDIKIEGNIEYRFNVVKQLNAALFIDAGNIWLLHSNASYPLGEFEANRFLGEIGIGTGIGFRFDFSFFVLRLDGAIKLKDPSLPVDDRWTFGKQPIKYGVLNFGIGYPF